MTKRQANVKKELEQILEGHASELHTLVTLSIGYNLHRLLNCKASLVKLSVHVSNSHAVFSGNVTMMSTM